MFTDSQLQARVWPRVTKTATCWLWQGARTQGYGYVYLGGRSPTGSKLLGRVHRLTYQWEHGPIPPKLQIDHLCRVRHCVNPDHLELVTTAENTRRGINVNRLKSHCINGHEYSERNTIRSLSKGYWRRKCRVCYNKRRNKWRRDKRLLEVTDDSIR
jgi:hypothetical protein